MTDTRSIAGRPKFRTCHMPPPNEQPSHSTGDIFELIAERRQLLLEETQFSVVACPS